MLKKSMKRFDIALTFSGEHRKYVQDVAEFLARRCSYERVFYDSWYQEELARSRLDNHLHKIYTKESELVVVFASREYGEKFWCKLEWNAIQTIQFRSQPVEQVLLVGLSRLEENAISGLKRTHGYINAEGKHPQELGELILQRLERLGIKPRYAQLEALLKARRWEEADRETGKQMCQVMGRQDEGTLRVEDIENFPCADLRAIDQLWVTHSNGKFGFSVQRKIWQQCGSPTKYGKRQWEKFAESVGWYDGAGRIRIKRLGQGNALPTFFSDLSSARQGHLPVFYSEGYEVGGRYWEMYYDRFGELLSGLFSRTQICKL